MSQHMKKFNQPIIGLYIILIGLLFAVILNIHSQNLSYTISNPQKFLPSKMGFIHTDCSDWSEKTIEQVGKFVFFFGICCGFSTTGNIVDEHPNAIVANGYSLWEDIGKRSFSGYFSYYEKYFIHAILFRQKKQKTVN